ncbi:MAG: hydantoinase B/oxoprolinase family protein [Gammaproteobacteria bacterium]|nr:hydantoinase B/oxoprolinase family protein [Gammaproteobacteria bacterium]MCI0591031.1 hydantoinase B/oxoprolinase family protein [Gammaproteobacteria bacterium]
MDPVELSLFSSRMQAVCGEMGAILKRTAFSPNIKDRLDFSCAVFDAEGQLCAQAAHIPVHLGSMAYAMADVVEPLEWRKGTVVILNDPFLGGTHLPDVTLIAPLFSGSYHLGFVANRAHHADIGAATPGSMPLADALEDEGIIIPPSYLMRDGEICEPLMVDILRHTRNPSMGRGDLAAQVSANLVGLKRLEELVSRMGKDDYCRALDALNHYGESLAVEGLRDIPTGTYCFHDVMDDDGQGRRDIPIRVTLTVLPGQVCVDFGGTAEQVRGNINCPLSVAAAGVYYAFHCLMPMHTPACAGSFRPITLKAPKGCLLNAQRPAAVAAGNVETSTRVVDVILGALSQALPKRIPAASHGTMNNIAMGSEHWDYYETLGGGMGAGRDGGGLGGVQTHMTNTRNTPVEVVEMYYPLRIRRYALRDHSGGVGWRAGGDGLEREYEFLAETTVTLLTERRRHAPWGLNGGGDGQRGVNLLNDHPLAGKVSFSARCGDRLTIKTPGGGGWGPR